MNDTKSELNVSLRGLHHVSVEDIIEFYRRNQGKFCKKSYHDIRKSAWRRGAWYKLSRLKCRTLVARRLGPDGENLYEPYGK